MSTATQSESVRLEQAHEQAQRTLFAAVEAAGLPPDKRSAIWIAAFDYQTALLRSVMHMVASSSSQPPKASSQADEFMRRVVANATGQNVDVQA